MGGVVEDDGLLGALHIVDDAVTETGVALQGERFFDRNQTFFCRGFGLDDLNVSLIFYKSLERSGIRVFRKKSSREDPNLLRLRKVPLCSVSTLNYSDVGWLQRSF